MGDTEEVTNYISVTLLNLVSTEALPSHWAGEKEREKGFRVDANGM